MSEAVELVLLPEERVAASNDEFLRNFPYLDERGSVHHPETGNFVNPDDFYAKYRTEHGENVAEVKEDESDSNALIKYDALPNGRCRVGHEYTAKGMSLPLEMSGDGAILITTKSNKEYFAPYGAIGEKIIDFVRTEEDNQLRYLPQTYPYPPITIGEKWQVEDEEIDEIAKVEIATKLFPEGSADISDYRPRGADPFAASYEYIEALNRIETPTKEDDLSDAVDNGAGEEVAEPKNAKRIGKLARHTGPAALRRSFSALRDEIRQDEDENSGSWRGRLKRLGSRVAAFVYSAPALTFEGVHSLTDRQGKQANRWDALAEKSKHDTRTKVIAGAGFAALLLAGVAVAKVTGSSESLHHIHHHMRDLTPVKPHHHAGLGSIHNHVKQHSSGIIAPDHAAHKPVHQPIGHGRDMELKHYGDTIWGEEEQLIANHHPHLSSAAIETRTAHVVASTLRANHITYYSAHYLPVGYHYHIPHHILEEMLKKKTD